MGFVKEASDAIKNTLVICRDGFEFDIAKHAIVEFCMAFGLTNDELTEALNLAAGNSAVEDAAIDEIVETLK